VYRITSKFSVSGVRDYVHIQDLALGHIAATNMILSQNFCGWKVYNLGTGSGLSVLQLIKAFEEASGQKVPCEIVGRRAGDIDASYADVSLAKKELHWQATKGVLDMCM
jgi:UDP-glucose 4-epimerase